MDYAIDRYLKLPLNLEDVTQQRDFRNCSLEQSIDQHIGLILITQFEEHRYDYSYGSEIWELDFSLIPSVSQWTDRLARSISNSLQTHEKRLFNIKVTIDLKEVDTINPERSEYRLRKKILLTTAGLLTETREQRTFHHELFLSPVSLD